MRTPNEIALFFCLLLPCLAMSSNAPDDPTACDLEVSVPQDFHICFDEEFDLDGEIDGDYEDFIWLENGDETNYGLNEEVSIDQTTTFTLIAWGTSEENIIVNGDFEDGNEGFTTDYVVGTFSCYGAGYLDCEGTYDVIDNPNLGHTNFAACSDADGGGNMMVVNGAANLQQIWCQEVCVEAETTYEFSAWGASVNPSSPAILQFAIDGNLIGDLFTLSSSLCDWEEFAAEWYSESSETIEICVTNQNTATGGNDFALDNIAFYQVCEDQASFTVTHSTFEVDFITPEELDCQTLETEIYATVDPPAEYDFQLFFEEDEIEYYADDEYYSILDELGEYELVITDMYGCEMILDFEVEGEFNEPDVDVEISNILDCNQPTATLSADTNDRGLDFEWYDSNMDLISEDDEIDVDSSAMYFLLSIDDDTGCSSLDSILVPSDQEAEPFNLLNTAADDCTDLSSLLFTSLMADSVIWQFEDHTLMESNDSISVNQSGMYTALIVHSNGCVSMDSFDVEIHAPAFDYEIQFDSLINCLDPVSQINLELDTSLFTVVWDDPSSIPINELNPELENGAELVFTISDSLNCQVTDSIRIIEDFEIPEYTLHQDTIDCISNQAVFLIDNPENAFLIEWVLPDAGLVQADSVIVSQLGELSFSLVADNGCSIKDTIDIQASQDFPEISIEGPRVLDCNNMSIELIAHSDQNNVQYFWTDGSSQSIGESQSITVSEAGSYNLQVSNDMSCISYISHTVQIDTLAPEFILPLIDTIDCNRETVSGNINILSSYDSLAYMGDWLDASSLEYSIDTAGLYALTIVSQNGCSTSKELQVIEDMDIPSLLLPQNQSLNCDNESVDLIITNSSNYENHQWEINDSIVLGDQILANSEGLYIATVWAKNGCSTSDTLQVDADYSVVDFSVESSMIDCFNDLSEVSITTSDNYASHQVFQSGILISNALEFSVSGTEEIEIIMWAASGCESETTHGIELDTITFDFDLSAEDLSCADTLTQIHLNSAEDFLTAELYNPTGTNIGDIDQELFDPGIYRVELTFDNGCIRSKNIDIKEITDPPVIGQIDNEDLICEEALLLSEIDVTGGTAPYQLLIDNNPIGWNELPVILEQAGDHILSVIDNNECKSDTSITVNELVPVEADLDADIELNFGESHQIIVQINKAPEEIESIQWYPLEGLSCYDCLEPKVTAEGDMDYTITIVDIRGCVTELEFRLRVVREIRYYIPNVISPVGNGNSRFTLFCNEEDIENINSLRIFDRWGNLVFDKNNFKANEPDLGWDGTIDGKYAEQGVFVYVAEVLFRNGETEILSGDLSVVR